VAQQGFKERRQSTRRAYRFRGLTRDPTKPSARELTNEGSEMVGVSLAMDNEPKVRKAFKGANIAFVMADFWEHLNKQSV